MTGKLKSKGKYCCLGVLCELAVEEKVIPEPILLKRGVDFCYEYAGNTIELTNPVMEWAGMQTPHGVLPSKNALVNMNDKGSTFAEIAREIELNYQFL